MGAIHGRDRFKCDGCHQCFSWRLDLKDHMKMCKSQNFRNSSCHKRLEVYILDICLLCGQKLTGVHSEEASFVKGAQNLYHSNRPLRKALEVITHDSSFRSRDNDTVALCKTCMNAVNRWDETHKQLEDISSSIRAVYQKVQYERKNKLLDSYFDSDIDKSILSPVKEETEGNRISDKPQCETSKDIEEKIGGDVLYDKTKSTTTEKKYECGCGKMTYNLDEMVDHQLRRGCKVKTKKFPCSYCDAVFFERKLLIAHKKDCIKKSLVNGAHECDICGRRFLVRGRVETHKRTAHGIGTADHQLCSYCGRTFMSKYSMSSHLAREHGIGHVKIAVTCEFCGKKFSEKSSYQSHIKSVHLEHTFECELCGKKFGTKGMRNHHINEVHNNSCNYKCTVCGENFKLIFKYRYHMRKMHSSTQHKCKDCGKTFIMSSDLYRHIRGVHMGIRDRKRYPCKVCGRLFPSMYKVKRHTASHGIRASKDKKHSIDVKTKPKITLDLQVKETEQISPLVIHEENFVTNNFVKGMTPTTLMQRKLRHIGSTSSDPSTNNESSIATTLSTTNADGTSIDVHQLPSTEIYTTPHITTLTPEILQGNLSTEVVAAESVTVDPVSTIVVSASAVQECINANNLNSTEQQQLEELNALRRGSTIIQPALQSSLVPMAQMIVFEESMAESGHNNFTVQSSNQVISVSQCGNQTISGSQIPNQVICIPHSSAESAPNHTQARFAVPLTQHHQSVLNHHKLPSIQYENYSSS